MKNSTRTTIKLALIFGIMICLLIPQFTIMNLIHERSGYKYEATNKVAGQWGRQQTVIGPVLSVPFYEYNSKGEGSRRHAYFMPEELNATSHVEVQELEKSIYKIPVFTSNNKLSVKFGIPNFDKWNIEDDDILWEQTKLVFRVNDPKGILKTPSFSISEKKIEFEPAGRSVLGNASMEIKLQEEVIKSGFSGDIEIEVKGTESFHVAPVGKSTSYVMTSNWPHPNFQGNGEGFAPVERQVDSEGFTATWKATKFNATYAYEWLDHNLDNLHQYMGVNFYQLANHYTKTERSVKYMLLIVGLIFLSFLLSELLYNLRIHPFQYVLVGAAIVIFYILLLAISEYTGYNMSYGISAISTVVLVTGYCGSVFKSRRMVVLEGVLLVILFSFLFIIINAMEYSLLMGAVGLFVILAITMYFTRKIKWYEDDV